MIQNNHTRSFARSFKPHINVKRGETCTSLKKHFRGALRQVVGYLEILAALDPERFVWPSVSDIARHCKDYRTKKVYKTRIVKYAKLWLRQHGVIGPQISRERNGVIRHGFIVMEHKSAPISAPICAPLSAPQNRNQCTLLCTAECTTVASQTINESRGYKEDGKVSPEFSESFSAPNLLALEPCKPLSPETPGGSAGNAKKLGPNPLGPESALSVYVRELEPVATLLDEAAKTFPVPGHWGAAVEFLNAVIADQHGEVPAVLINVRNAIQERVIACK